MWPAPCSWRTSTCLIVVLRRGERVVDRKDRPAGDPEADLDAARLERADNGLRAGEALAFVGIGRGRLGGGGPLLCGGHTSSPGRSAGDGRGNGECVGDLVGDLVGGRRAAQVGRAGAVVEHAGDGALDRACGGGLPELVEQQRDREDRAGGIGLAVPAMSGAEPWIGSKMPGPPSASDAEGARPMPPLTAAARSESTSPNRFSVTITS